ncbi:hypothetical protein JXJ21_07060 [candidate division KSB1 bacterium]|nr:hypothetical protein [candidate division KSB1 bacterium]
MNNPGYIKAGHSHCLLEPGSLTFADVAVSSISAFYRVARTMVNAVPARPSPKIRCSNASHYFRSKYAFINVAFSKPTNKIPTTSRVPNEVCFPKLTLRSLPPFAPGIEGIPPQKNDGMTNRSLFGYALFMSNRCMRHQNSGMINPGGSAAKPNIVSNATVSLSIIKNTNAFNSFEAFSEHYKFLQINPTDFIQYPEQDHTKLPGVKNGTDTIQIAAIIKA